jgi:hypothetical protein
MTFEIWNMGSEVEREDPCTKSRCSHIGRTLLSVGSEYICDQYYSLFMALICNVANVEM